MHCRSRMFCLWRLEMFCKQWVSLLHSCPRICPCELRLFSRHGTQSPHVMANLTLDVEGWIPSRLTDLVASRAGHEITTVFCMCCRKCFDALFLPRSNLQWPRWHTEWSQLHPPMAAGGRSWICCPAFGMVECTLHVCCTKACGGWQCGVLFGG